MGEEINTKIVKDEELVHKRRDGWKFREEFRG